jgi:HD-GYP domain-containing protein (c-di-GMP phosphodiesterase class II)
MKHAAMKFPVRRLDGQLLLPEGAVLTPESLRILVDSNRETCRETVSLLRFGTLREDLLVLLHENPYHVIFNDPLKTDTVLRLMDRVHLTPPLLALLDGFKNTAPETYQHILRVTALSAFIGRFLLDTVQDLPLGIQAAVLHDLGKSCIPNDLLEKKGPLTRLEREVLEQHTLAGYVLVSYYLKKPDTLPARVARDHHERRDGSGYPRGTAQEDLMVEIIAVSDIYDALISHRAYREKAFENRRALEEITEMAENGKIGWEVVRALVSHNRETKPAHEDCVVSGEKRGYSKKDGE